MTTRNRVSGAGRGAATRRRGKTALAAGALLLAATGSSRALVINDGLAAAAGGVGNYYDSANTFPNVVALVSPVNGATCSGTLINARTVLTDAHCVQSASGRLTVNGTNSIGFAPIATDPNPNNRLLSGAIPHPGYNAALAANDFALVSLAAPVTAIQPVRLIGAGTPLPSAGTLLQLAGYGFTGTGSAPPQQGIGPYDDKRRLGLTRLNVVATGDETTAYPGSMQRFLIARFEDPNAPSENAAGPVPALQAGGAPGDSGGPVFLMTAQGLVQIGITTVGFSLDDSPQFGYGSYTAWSIVGDYLGWIAENNPLRSVSSVGGDRLWSDAAGWRDAVSGLGGVPDNQDGGFTGTGAVGRYYNVLLSAPGTVTVDMNPTVDSLLIDGPLAALNLPGGRTLTSLIGTQLADGRLNVDGTLNTGWLALTGGVLTGSGQIVAPGNVSNIGTVVQPGSAHALGTLTIQGNYSQAGPGVLSIRIAGTQSDRLAVTGSAALGGALYVTPRGAVTPRTAYQLLSAGQVTGRFDTLAFTTSSAFLAPLLTYEATRVSFSLERNALGFAAVTVKGNDRAVATAADSLPWGNTLHDALVQLGAPDARAAFTNLSGDLHASLTGTLIDGGRLIQEAAVNRLRQATGAAASSGDGADVVRVTRSGLEVWGLGFGAWNSRKGNDAASLHGDTAGFVAGADMPVGNWRLGLMAGFANGRQTAIGRAASAVIDTVHVGAYAGTRWGALGLRLGADQAWHDLGTRRAVAFAGYADSLRASYDARTTQLFAEAGYAMTVMGTAVEPFLGFAYSHLEMDRFTETGQAAALRGRGTSSDAAFSSLGVRAARTMALSPEVSMTARGALGWRHVYGDVSPGASLAFRDGGTPFSVAGTPIARDSLLAETGVEVSFRGRTALRVSYSAQIARNSQDQTLRGQLAWAF